MEKTINTRSKSQVDNLTSLSSNTGSFNMSVNFDDKVVNVESELVTFPDSPAQEIELLERRKLKNGTEGIENELLVNQDLGIILEVDVTGELIISDEEAEKFFIDDIAQLNFNYE
jgi:hypothetical protein